MIRLSLLILGLAVGMGLNRLADWLSPWVRRCAYCRRQWYGSAWAVVVYLRGRGKCAGCAAPLPLRPVVVELLCAVGLPLLWPQEGEALQFAFLAAYLFALLLLSVTDLEQRRLPNVVMYPTLVLALIGAFVSPPGDWRSALLGGVSALAFFSLLYWVGKGFAALLRRKAPSFSEEGMPGEKALGAGDIKLAVFVGLVTGWPDVMVALGLGMVLAAATALVLMTSRLLRGEYRPGQTMPYGPFLAVGAATVLLFRS